MRDYFLMTSVTERLDSALDDTQNLVQSIENDLDRLSRAPPSECSTMIPEIERRIAELDSRIQRMENDVRNCPTNSRDYYESEIRELRGNYQNCMREIRQKKQSNSSKEAGEARRQELKNNAHSDLQSAIAEGHEVVQVQNNTMSTLNDDRERITKINQNLTDVGDEAVSGKVRAKRMIRRIILHKVISWVICVILFAILITIIACKAAGKWPGWEDKK